MGEPNLDEFLRHLASKDYLREIGNRKIDEEVLWYCDSSRAPQVVKALLGKGESERGRIITSLATLYPLSANIVKAIVQQIRESDQFVSDAFQLHYDLVRESGKAFQAIGQNRRSTSVMQDLRGKLAKLEQEAEQLSPIREEIENYNKMLEELRIANDESGLKSTRDALKQQVDEYENVIAGLKREIESKKKKKEELQEREKHYLDELKNLEQVGSEEQKRLWRELLATFPGDMEEAG